jgi:hypothetical protein
MSHSLKLTRDQIIDLEVLRELPLEQILVLLTRMHAALIGALKMKLTSEHVVEPLRRARKSRGASADPSAEAPRPTRQAIHLPKALRTAFHSRAVKLRRSASDCLGEALMTWMKMQEKMASQRRSAARMLEPAIPLMQPASQLPRYYFSVSDELWAAFRGVAADRERGTSECAAEAIQLWLRTHPAPHA